MLISAFGLMSEAAGREESFSAVVSMGGSSKFQVPSSKFQAPGSYVGNRINASTAVEFGTWNLELGTFFIASAP
jgi:hypothetical protein